MAIAKSKKSKFTIIHPYEAQVEIIAAPDRNCPADYAYLLQEQDNFLQMIRTMYIAEKETNEWIRKYENVLKGLAYWKDKALTK